MKKMVTAFAMFTLALNAYSAPHQRGARVGTSFDLAGKQYCRMVPTGGMFGQPVGERQHCVKFVDDLRVSDNANTFFGNPPAHGTYEVSGRMITLSFNSSSRPYTVTYRLSATGKTITGTEGAVLRLMD